MTLTAEQLAQLRVDIERRKSLPEFGPDTSIERLKIINATQQSFTPAVVEALLDELDRKDKRIAELEEQLRREQDYHLSVDMERMELWKRLEARTVTVKLPTAYDLTGETDGNCSLNDASMQPDVEGCYFRRRDVESACAAAGINLTVEG